MKRRNFIRSVSAAGLLETAAAQPPPSARRTPGLKLDLHTGGAVPYLMKRMDSGFRDFAECRVKIDELPSRYLKRVYYETVTFSPHNLMMTRDLVGSDHMVMGSDFPHLLGSIDKAVPSIEALNIPTSDKRRIFEGTPLSILNNV